MKNDCAARSTINWSAFRIIPLNTLRGFTSIGRPIDPNYPTNRAIALLALAVAVGGTVVSAFRGGEWPQSITFGLGAGFAVFLAWALCRELDPDHDLSAFLAAALVIAGLFVWGLPDTVALFWLLLAVRVVNRSTGLPPTIFDSLSVLGLGLWLNFSQHWGFGVVAAVAFFLDARLVRGEPRQLLFAGASLVAAVLTALGARDMPITLSPVFALTIALTAAFLPVIFASGRLVTTGDDTSEPLDPNRVRSGQILALLTGVGAALWGGPAGFAAMLSLWAAAAGAAGYKVQVASSRP
ncbi:MAG: efflux RND transporter permease subunit [Gemmatimonadaceae bacterium]|nr:efflux RND transporter permease subunit [Gloeobacterales cyanobacterium ES-bin-141]